MHGLLLFDGVPEHLYLSSRYPLAPPGIDRGRSRPAPLPAGGVNPT